MNMFFKNTGASKNQAHSAPIFLFALCALVFFQSTLMTKGTISFMNIFKSDQNGFTLLELMIVIAIIFFLAAVALPNYLRSRDVAKYSACLKTLTNVRIAEEMYIADSHKYITIDSKYLVMYMTATCTDPAGAGTNCVDKDGINLVDVQMSKHSYPVTFPIGPNDYGKDVRTFAIWGIAKDRNTCHICVIEDDGFRPRDYKDCPAYKNRWHDDCLKPVK